MKRLLAVFACGMLLAVGSVGLVAAQDPLNQACDSVNSSSESSTCDSRTSTNPLTGPNGLLIKVTDLVALIAGIAAVIMVMIGGFRYITANGDAQAAANARRTIFASIIGLIVIVAARALVVFVVRRLS